MDSKDGSNLLEEFFKRLKEEMNKIIPVNIMTIGKTGTGKSTLINAVFRSNLAETGIGRPVTKHLRKITKDEVPLAIYDTRGLELDSSVQAEIKEEISAEIQRRALDRDERDYIHVVWYCINANSNRLEDYEEDWIRELAKVVPVIIVLTQSIGTNSKQFASQLEAINLPVVGVRPVLAIPYEISEDLTVPTMGLNELVSLTYEVLPEAVRKAFVNAQKIDIEKKAATARRWAMTYVSGAFGVGFTPIPFSDALLLAPAQVTMLAHITAIFGIPVDKALLTAIIGAIGGIGGVSGLGRYIVSNLLKLIPGAGTLAGGLISGATASLLTTALAYAYIEVMKTIVENEYQGRKTNAAEIMDLVKSQFEAYIRR